MKKLYLSIFIFIISISLIGCNNSQEQDSRFISRTEILLDTAVEIKIYQPDDNTEQIMEKAFKKIEDLENLLSIYIEGSDLHSIAENAGKRPVEVSESTYYVIKKSIKYSKMTDGMFDITIGPLVNLWDIDLPEGHMPTKEELDSVMSKIDYRKIVLDEDKRTVMLKDDSMVADLGAIAKGYIADEIKILLEDSGVECAIINLGGNVLLIGEKPDGTDFSIGVQDPQSERGAYLGVISASDLSIVTSGDYERYFEVGGKRYHHILDPTTGYPSDNELSQVTVISKESIDGDGLSTSAFFSVP